MAENTKFDSAQYSWADVSVSMGGRIVTGLTSVSYTVKQAKSVLKGRGNKGHKILRGDKEFEGSIKIWQSELQAMIKSAPGKDVLSLNFDLVVAYTPADGGQNTTDILVSCEFTEYKKEMNQGDTNMEIECPIIFLDLKEDQ
ncbi:hypothetical protein [Chryseobacterium herbae]|uniref:Phage tail tube protein n=1 Tax=Chryseobacterium herbae TaxID=2976476 RepID=A0ABT2J066_9FLAO|nr:hypothetical protein [Chryseobacterium sp. pc1-10]MCT2563950.1 hypothetical protein [Chryseobacterium sp. pc1-10]